MTDPRDLEWVDWERINIPECPTTFMQTVSSGLVHYSQLWESNRHIVDLVLVGFSIPFKNLPIYLSVEGLMKSIASYRLEVGR